MQKTYSNASEYIQDHIFELQRKIRDEDMIDHRSCTQLKQL